jgi:nicotinate-nucleotide adenylyltransferase
VAPTARSARHRIGILGGSFDPVHAGHLHVARVAGRELGLGRVLFVPAAQSPHKLDRELADASDRLAMLEIALEGEPTWEICTLELERGGPSYTIDTLRALPAALGLPDDARLFLLIGGDNLAGLPRWKDAAEILERAEPAIVVRDGDEPGLLAQLQAGGIDPRLLARLERGLLRAPPVPVSATELRAALERGEDPGNALPAGVLEYIRARGLYAGPRRGP